MRSYIHTRQKEKQHSPSAATSSAMAQDASSEPPPEERCRAMMEVVRKEDAGWVVSKLSTDHKHPCCDDTTSAPQLPIPAVGMEFETVEAAKAFYYEYADRSGFEPRVGSNRRSAGNGDLIMQRFLCWHGNYLMYRKDMNSNSRKRGPYKKRSVDSVIIEENSLEKHLEKRVIVKQSLTDSNIGGLAGGVAISSDRVSFSSDGKVLDATSQSKLLREMGIRVARYTVEERRNIVHKYVMKRNSRQSSERSIKGCSRQALAERHQQGAGGKFLKAEDAQVSNTQDETEGEIDHLNVDVFDREIEPKLGMVFPSEDKAYQYYIKYAGKVGFSVRKGWWDKSARNVTRSRVLVCSCEGFRPKNTVVEPKRPRPETRTGCPALMAIKITPNGKYHVTEFVADHNHELAAPLDIQVLRTQKSLANFQYTSPPSVRLIPPEYKNYLRAKRMNDMQTGDACAIIEYLQKMKCENTSFFYAIQVDEDDQLVNIFWADVQSQIDYDYFGDVVCLDTTYKVHEYGRPFVQFLGVNHHKQTSFFGAALLYDETVESFQWLLETFNGAMCGKQPKTIFTDHNSAIADAVATVWPCTSHRLCVWHICQAATKHLIDVFSCSETFSNDLDRCLYDLEDEEEFESEWKVMLEKYNIKENEWLSRLFEIREKWALMYGHHMFSAGIMSTLRSENFSAVMEEHLKQEVGLSHFFKQYKLFLLERRYGEQESNYHANQDNPRIPPLRLLWQAANAYTPVLFEMFRIEFELSTNCMIYACREAGTLSEYELIVKDKSKRHIVSLDSSEGTLMCTCKKFESIGIQCCHALKVLEFRYIQDLPPQYILKRWRKDAKAGVIRDSKGFRSDDDAKTFSKRRYNSLCRIFYKIATRAAENTEAYAFLESQSDQLLERVEQILQSKFLEKSSSNNVSKGQPQNQVQTDGQNHDNNSSSQMRSVKKKKDGGVRHKHKADPEGNQKRKRKSGQPDGTDINNEPPVVSDGIPANPVIPSNQSFQSGQFFQGSCMPTHQFGVGPVQGFQEMTQFNQEPSLNQMQPCQDNAQLGQVSVPADMHCLVANAEVNQERNGQGHCTIPVWDFL